MNHKVVTAVYMGLSGISFAIAIITSTNNHELAMSVGMIWMLNVMIRFGTKE